MRRDAPDYDALRAAMVATQLRARGIGDERVLEAMASVPRERFVPDSVRASAYDDSALPIGHNQTISQPWIVAAICQGLELRGGEEVLEIGTGLGYSAAVLARLSDRVVSVEVLPELAERARESLAELSFANVEVRTGDGGLGPKPGESFEAIAVHAAAPALPPALAAALRPGGRLVIPLSTGRDDTLVAVRRTDDGAEPRYESTAIAPCRFVPLVGQAGFQASGR